MFFYVSLPVFENLCRRRRLRTFLEILALMGEILWIGVVDVCTCCALSAGTHQINVGEEKSLFFCDARGNVTAEITLNSTSTLMLHAWKMYH